MKNKDFSKYTSDEDEKITLGNIYDKYNSCISKNIPQSSLFLNEREQQIACAMLDDEYIHYVLYGGYENAERAMLFFIPDYLNDEYPIVSDEEISYLRISVNESALKFSKKSALTHRDYLGSVLGLGIKRSQIGDILVSENSCCMIVASGIADFIVSELVSVGRFSASCQKIDRDMLVIPEQKFDERTDTVASLRIDCILSSAYGISRSEAEKLIRGGYVSQAHRIIDRPDKKAEPDTTISVKGYGRFEFSEVGGLSKKGRIFIKCKVYK